MTWHSTGRCLPGSPSVIVTDSRFWGEGRAVTWHENGFVEWVWLEVSCLELALVVTGSLYPKKKKAVS